MADICKQHFQMHFLQNLPCFDLNFNEFGFWRIWSKISQAKTWCWIGHKPLADPNLIQIYDVIWHIWWWWWWLMMTMIDDDWWLVVAAVVVVVVVVAAAAVVSYQYRKSHCGDKTILRPSYLHNRISYTGKMTSLYWIRLQVSWGCLMLIMGSSILVRQHVLLKQLQYHFHGLV